MHDSSGIRDEDTTFGYFVFGVGNDNGLEGGIPFTEKPDFKDQEPAEKKVDPKGAPEEEVKSYREYPSFKPEQEYQPTFKGDASNE